MSALIVFLLILGLVLAGVRACGVSPGRVDLGWVAVAVGFLVALLLNGLPG